MSVYTLKFRLVCDVLTFHVYVYVVGFRELHLQISYVYYVSSYYPRYIFISFYLTCALVNNR